jgi:hypothetical protein
MSRRSRAQHSVPISARCSAAQRTASPAPRRSRPRARRAQVTHELLLGARSRWVDYLRSLPPDGEAVPALWGAPGLAALQGSDLQVAAGPSPRGAFVRSPSVLPALGAARPAAAPPSARWAAAPGVSD